ncbi:MAG: methylmalonyl-CoA mutase family protein [Dehalococcoidia bacterium]
MNDTDDIARKKQEWARQKKLEDLSPSGGQLDGGADILYTPADVAGGDYLRDLGFPGEYPFTRGIHPAMYRATPWLMRLYSGFGSAEDTNQRWKYLIEQGTMGVVCAFDLPTQLGLDSDHDQARHEVGRVGVAVDTLRDFEVLYDGLPLEKMSTNMNIAAPAPILLAMYLALAGRAGVLSSSLRGILSNDLLSEFVSRGAWIFPVKPALRLTTDIIEYCIKHLPHFNPIVVRGFLIREGGGSMAYEMGYTFANAMTYIESALERGLDIDEVAPRISFFLATGTEFLEEAAKFRAGRRLWAKLMKEKYGAKKPASMMMRFMTMVCGSYYRREEPENNLVRGAYGILGAALGGLQGAIHPALDEAYALPTERTARLAIRTQQICAYETGVMDTVDPLGGSYYVEALTDRFQEEIQNVLGEVELMGGMTRAIEQGYIQKKLAEQAYQRSREEDSGQRVVVAMNKFPSEEGKREIEIHRPDDRVAREQMARLERVRAERDGDAVRRSLKLVEAAARGEDNILPSLIEAVGAYATIGEITETLTGVFGQFREPSAAF